MPVIISASWPSFPTCLAICSPPAKSGSLDGICIDKVLSQEVRSLQPSALLTTRYFEILTFYYFPVLSSPRAKIFLFSYLITSVFIYNTKEVIDRNSIKKLGLILNLSEKIIVRTFMFL